MWMIHINGFQSVGSMVDGREINCGTFLSEVWKSAA